MTGQLTHYGENKLADKRRGVAPVYPASWFFALGSAADKATFTEITGANLARVAVLRDLTKFAGTQGAGTTTASSGTSHTSSNNADIQYAAASANLAAPAVFVGMFDASTGGNCWAFFPIPSITVNSGDTPAILAGALVFTLGLADGCTSYLANKLIDEFFRAVAYAWPATLYARLYTAAANDAGVGTEVAYSGYARPSLASTFAALSATSVPGGTAASAGTDARIANNAAVAFPAPTADAVIVGDGWGDAASGGNLLFRKTYAAAKSLSAGGLPPTWAPNTVGFTVR